MTLASQDAPRIEIRSHADLRDGLSRNHDAGKGAHWLVLWKKHTAHYVPLDDVVEELLCWG